MHIVYLNAAPKPEYPHRTSPWNPTHAPWPMSFFDTWHPLSGGDLLEMGTYKWLTYARHVEPKLQLM